MGSRYLTDLANVVRGAGLVVQEEPGWQTRARGSGGYDSGRPNHIMVHHTASGPSSDGQPDVNYQCYGSDAKPVANLYLSRSGKVWIMAAGATNTNGTGTDPCGVTPMDSMNSHAIGIEAGNNGVGEVWPQAQQDAYVKLVAALCNAYGIPTGRIHSHIEWAPGRKIDPAGPSQWPPINSSQSWDMNAFRGDVWLAPNPTPTPGGDDPMRILILMDLPETPSILLSGHIGTWLDPPRYNAFHTAYPSLVDEQTTSADLANVVMTGRIPVDHAGNPVVTWEVLD